MEFTVTTLIAIITVTVLICGTVLKLFKKERPKEAIEQENKLNALAAKVATLDSRLQNGINQNIDTIRNDLRRLEQITSERLSESKQERENRLKEFIEIINKLETKIEKISDLIIQLMHEQRK